MQRKSSQTTVVTWIKSYHNKLCHCFFSSTPHRNHHLPTKMENQTPPAQRLLPIAPRQYRRAAVRQATLPLPIASHPSILAFQLPTHQSHKVVTHTPSGCHLLTHRQAFSQPRNTYHRLRPRTSSVFSAQALSRTYTQAALRIFWEASAKAVTKRNFEPVIVDQTEPLPLERH